MEITKKVLRELYAKKGLTQTEIAKELYTTQCNISKWIRHYKITKGGRKNIYNNNKEWTEEQKEYLIENFGTKSYEEIGKNKIIKKTASAVQQMAILNLKLGDPKQYGDSLTKTTLAKKLYISPFLMDKWINECGLPVTIKNISVKKEFHMVKIADFWKWAEEHKELIKWNKFKVDVLGAEPSWANNARLEARKTKPLKDGISYTNKDDIFIMSAYNAGIPLEKIGESMNRSGDAINMRLKTIQAERKRRPLWSEEDKKQLKELVKQGYKTKQIMVIMDRDFMSIKAARERFITKPLKNKKP